MKVSRRSWHYRLYKWMSSETDSDLEKYNSREYVVFVSILLVIFLFNLPLLVIWQIARKICSSFPKPTRVEITE